MAQLGLDPAGHRRDAAYNSQSLKGFAADKNFAGHRQINGLGSDIRSVQLEDGSVAEVGWVLMLDQWNSAFYEPLEKKHQSQDIGIHKNPIKVLRGARQAKRLWLRAESGLCSSLARTLISVWEIVFKTLSKKAGTVSC